MPEGQLTWLADALGLPAAVPQNLEGPTSDGVLWQEALRQAPALQEVVAAGADWPTWPALLQDAFNTFFKVQPTLRPLEAVDPAHQANRPYVEQLLADTATAQMRTTSVLDELVSAVATLETGRALATAIRAHGGLDQALRAQTAPPPGTQGQLHKAVHQATQAGTAEAEAVHAALITWGIESAGLQQVPLGERITLAQRLAGPTFRRVADLVGRLRNLARARQGGTLRHARDELHRITLGQDLGRVLPAELAMVRHPLRRRDFGRRWLDGQLLQYDLRPTPRQGRGPLLCAIDVSGSMAGDRLAWAVAVGLALADTARRQRRDFAACVFDTEILATFAWPRHAPVDPREILRFATVAPGGGTNFAPPLTWALAQQATDRFRAADLVFITDGEMALDAATRRTFQEAKAACGLRVFSILIGGVAQELQQWSDRIWTIAAPDDEAAGELFADLVPVV